MAMPLTSPRNLYRGINAHLHSSLQAEDDAWNEFHAAYIIVLAMLLNPLLQRKGYVISPEKSLQIREESYLRHLVIREFAGNKLGEPLVFIELLSPTNKPYGGGFVQYREKRAQVLAAGIVLVELDFLHETPSVIAELPSYIDGETNAYPYHILVTNPRPTVEQGRMDVFGFSVDEPLPAVSVPLRQGDAIAVDFDAAYQQTYNSFATFSVRVDYRELPENFERYSAEDQKRILHRMKTIAAE